MMVKMSCSNSHSRKTVLSQKEKQYIGPITFYRQYPRASQAEKSKSRGTPEFANHKKFSKLQPQQ